MMSRSMVLLSVLLVSLGCSRPTAEDKATQDLAAKFVENRKGIFRRDYNLPDDPLIEVFLGKTKVTDAGLKELAALKNLTSLNLTSTKVARRLVEAGVSFVTISVPGGVKAMDAPGWDDHAINIDLPTIMRHRLPVYDQVVTTLINDLYERGLDKKCS